MKRSSLPAVLGVLCLLAGCTRTVGNGKPISVSRVDTAAHHIRTVFLIVMENHNWSDIKGNASAPYINHVLLPMSSYAQQYYNPPNLHPSLPNYLWLEAGTSFGIFDDLDPSWHSIRSHAHLVSLLRAVHISWRAYEQGMAPGTCPTSGRDHYAAKHDAFVYFTDVTSNSAYCSAHIRPTTQLLSDLAANRVARYNFIAPDLCSDMHDSCSPLNNQVAQGDQWLKQTMPAILQSKAYRQGGVVFLTWDEGEGGDGPIGMLVLSPVGRGHGYSNATHYTHSSTLRTIEEIFGVRPFLGGARQSNDLRGLFRVFP